MDRAGRVGAIDHEIAGLLLEFLGAVAALLATYFAWKALQSAQRTVQLELASQQERNKQRKLDLLDRLMLSTYKLQEVDCARPFDRKPRRNSLSHRSFLTPP